VLLFPNKDTIITGTIYLLSAETILYAGCLFFVSMLRYDRSANFPHCSETAEHKFYSGSTTVYRKELCLPVENPFLYSGK